MTVPGPPGGPAPHPGPAWADGPAPPGVPGYPPPGAPGYPPPNASGYPLPGAPGAPSGGFGAAPTAPFGVGVAPPGVPAPPPGPGAAPPFAAPPSEGRGVRLWLGLGVAALAVLLFCGGGGAALVGLVVSGSQAINEQARTVVGEYLDAIDDEEFGKAYSLLCDAARQRESSAEFQRRVSAEPEIASFQVGDVSLTSELSVPVDVTYASGGQDNLQVLLDQDSTVGLRVCDIR